MAAVGFILGALGFAVTLWQLHRTRSAAEAAAASSDRTKSILRTSDIRRTIAISQELVRRLLMPTNRLPIGERRMAAEDWLTIYARIHALLEAQELGVRHPSLVGVMDDIAAELLIALAALESRAEWKTYSLAPLRALIMTYNKEAEKMLERLTETAVATDRAVANDA